ncbi:MAG: hypothetical protein AAB601_01115 [Patescibacteria group bacterium]
MVKKVVAGALAAAAVMVPLAALAQGVTPPAPSFNVNITGYGGVISFINNIIGGWLFGLLMALAVIFLLYAAFLYLTAGGDDTKVATAKKIIVYAVVAIVIALLAKAIVTVLIASLQ